jgi:hypothetical protein
MSIWRRTATMSNSHSAVSNNSKSMGALMLLSEPVPRATGTSKLAGISATIPAVGQRHNAAVTASPKRPTNNHVAERGGSTKATARIISGTAATKPHRNNVRCFQISKER